MARPEKKPSEEQRKQVETLAGYGMTHEQIGNVLDITRPTLVKWYKKELKVGKDKAIATVLNGLFYNIKRKKEASIFFYLKTQLGWKEREDAQTQGTNITITLTDQKTDDGDRNAI